MHPIRQHNCFLSLSAASPTDAAGDALPAARPRLVKCLPKGTSRSAIYDLFRPFGAIHRVVLQNDGPAFTGLAVIEFFAEEDAIKATTEMHCAEVQGETITVQVYQASKGPIRGLPGPFVPAAAGAIPALPPAFVPRSASSTSMWATSASSLPDQSLSSPPSQFANEQGAPIDPRCVSLLACGRPLLSSPYSNLFIKCIGTLTSQDLFVAFKSFGKIISARAMKDPEGNARVRDLAIFFSTPLIPHTGLRLRLLPLGRRCGNRARSDERRPHQVDDHRRGTSGRYTLPRAEADENEAFDGWQRGAGPVAQHLATHERPAHRSGALTCAPLGRRAKTLTKRIGHDFDADAATSVFIQLFLFPRPCPARRQQEHTRVRPPTRLDPQARDQPNSSPATHRPHRGPASWRSSPLPLQLCHPLHESWRSLSRSRRPFFCLFPSSSRNARSLLGFFLSASDARCDAGEARTGIPRWIGEAVFEGDRHQDRKRERAAFLGRDETECGSERGGRCVRGCAERQADARTEAEDWRKVRSFSLFDLEIFSYHVHRLFKVLKTSGVKGAVRY